jgi:hypothetical protein
MANVISGHISGQYGGPITCDTEYGGTAATFCATNPGDCSHTVLVGTVTPNPFGPIQNQVYPDSTRILEGAPYDGPLSCTYGNYCATFTCDPAETYIGGAIYVNPGQCVELKFTLYERAGNLSTIFCDGAVTLRIDGATAPNLGVLTGEWYPANVMNASCCGQKDEYKLCAPEFYQPLYVSAYHRAYLSYKAFRAETLSYESDTSNWCCQRTECPPGTPYAEAIYDASDPSCIAYYAQNCDYPEGPRTGGGTCFADPDGSPNGTVAPGIEGPKYGTYLYCADQPCGARISFSPSYQGIILAPGGTTYFYAAHSDSTIFVDITGYPGCGVGCAEA